MSEIDEVLASYNFDEATVWDVYKERFLQCSADARQMYLQAFDKYVADEGKMSTISRETADLLTRKRELLSIHGTLRKLGR
jgi:hypothetical protein